MLKSSPIVWRYERKCELVLLKVLIYYGRQDVSDFHICGWNPWKKNSNNYSKQYFPVVLFIMLYKVILIVECIWKPKVWPFKRKLYKVALTFESMNDISGVTIQMKATEQ